MKTSSKSISFVWLVSYLVIFMLPFISSMFVHFEAVNIINEQNMQRAEQIINYEQREINQLYDACHTTYASLLQNANINDAINVTSPEQLSTIKEYRLKSDLTQMLRNQNYILKDIWVVFNHIGYCASTQRVVSLSDFFDAEGVSGKPIVSPENINRTYNGMFMRTSDGLAYFRTLGYSASNDVINMVLIVDDDLFLEKIREFLPQNSGIMLLYNSEDQLIFSTADVSEEFAEKAKNISDNDFKVRICGEKFLSSSSNLHGVKYVYLLGEKNLSQTVRILKIIIVATALFSLLVGSWMIYYLLKRNIEPVNDIMSMLGALPHETNEFDAIKLGINLHNKERNTLSRQINMFKPLAVNNLCHSFIAVELKNFERYGNLRYC